MRKKHWLAIVLVAIVGVSAYWYWNRTPAEPKIDPEKQFAKIPDRPGGYIIEMEEQDEPIIVGWGDLGRPQPPAPDEGPMPVVRLEPGMTQPARPDAELAPQMPFADDHDILGLRRNPVAAILDPKLARLNIFDGLEESEVVEPFRLPDYHHRQCPHYSGRPPR